MPVPTIGLSMIVKNEAEVILRCLESVRRLVDYVLIADTGSSDETQGIIRSYLEQIQLPGEVIEEPWRDFASNRTSALRALRARNAVDYALIIDADETIEYTADFDPTAFKASLTLDLYQVEIELGDVLYWRPQLLSTRREFSYRGVLHEFVDAPTDAGSGNAAGLRMMSGREQGARKRNPDTYQHDARVLEQALALEQDPFLRSRYIFYLAQSYRDSGDRERALAAYLARSTMGFWDEEVFVSLIYAARLMQDLGRSNDEVLSLYNRASTLCPGRAEALHGASKLLLALGRHEEAYEVAKRGAAIEMPGHGLFLERTVYAHDMQEQLALSAYWSERPAEALRIWLGLLADGRLPANEHARIARNGQFALDKLPAERNLGAPGRESLVAQHPLAAPRLLRPAAATPSVLLAILAKQMAPVLPLYLDCIEALDYPKSAISLHIRTNNNTDDTEPLLRQFVDRLGPRYAHVEFDATDVLERVQDYGIHDWNAERFRVLGRLRKQAMQRAMELGCAYYFNPDADNFLRPCTLRELVSLNLPIVAPFLRSIDPSDPYSNYHAEIDQNGYYAECDQFRWALNRWVRGVIEMPVVHSTYLVRGDVLPLLDYEDGSGRHDYVVFSERARNAGVTQYLDNRQSYGFIGRDDPETDATTARRLLAEELETARQQGPRDDTDGEASDEDWRRHVIIG